MEGKYLMLAVQELVYGDQREGRFVFCRDSKKPKQSGNDDRFTRDGMNPKSLLQTLMMRAGHSPPKYKTKHLKTNEFRALVEFKGMEFVGKPKKNKQLAERDAAVEALAWLTHTTDNSRDEDDKSPPDVTDNMLKLLRKHRRSKQNYGIGELKVQTYLIGEDLRDIVESMEEPPKPVLNSGDEAEFKAWDEEECLICSPCHPEVLWFRCFL
ncbi:hypothetical protein FEM48_Zijuj03G0028400 [Ziziphus jujuba var. spinosa]|uniref:DRBM domain-containing protein n=1 Tax=Ziziphus jujuba var. spinosa TaxID=714518 RepID=A0A978VMQ9_ZIZJJ|nr:hypothetical protein FEM48_Zijuj03G0028400 [Ziziphus jujuba var. spinosa]